MAPPLPPRLPLRGGIPSSEREAGKSDWGWGRGVQRLRSPTDYFLGCGLLLRSPSISITVCGVSWLSTWRNTGTWRGQYTQGRCRMG